VSDKDILTKAIDKALMHGWWPSDDLTVEASLPALVSYDPDTGEIEIVGRANRTIYWELNRLIYNHEFAKRLWGDKFINPEMRDDKGSKVIAMQQTAWRHHLRQMVVADDPIKYLGENL
jgi:hypothetical protein